MSPLFDRLKQQAASLDESERAELASHLLESLDADTSATAEEVEAQGNAESMRRVELVDRGEMATVSAEDVPAGKR